MDKVKDFIIYLNAIYKDFFCKFLKEGYEENQIISLFYEYLIDDKKNFLKFEMDYFNCDEYKNVDIKGAFKKYALSIYYMLYFYDTYGNIEGDEVCMAMQTYNINDKIYNSLFENAGIGLEIIDGMAVYLEMMSAKQKLIADNMKNDKNFEEVCTNNLFLATIYYYYSNLEVSEEEMIICNVSEIVDKSNIDNNFSGLGVNIYDNVKKNMLLESLIKDINLGRKVPYIKHLFSIMIQNLYNEIYYSKLNDTRKINKFDEHLFNIINLNQLSFEQLFSLFINNNIFSSYIIKTFYDVNIDVEETEFEARRLVAEDDNLEEKTKKYYVE